MLVHIKTGWGVLKCSDFIKIVIENLNFNTLVHQYQIHTLQLSRKQLNLSQWEIIKCANILKNAGRRTKRMKIGTHGLINSICGVLLGSGHFSSVWGHSVHVAKLPMLRFSKGYRSDTVFI